MQMPLLSTQQEKEEIAKPTNLLFHLDDDAKSRLDHILQKYALSELQVLVFTTRYVSIIKGYHVWNPPIACNSCIPSPEKRDVIDPIDNMRSRRVNAYLVGRPTNRSRFMYPIGAAADNGLTNMEIHRQGRMPNEAKILAHRSTEVW